PSSTPAPDTPAATGPWTHSLSYAPRSHSRRGRRGNGVDGYRRELPPALGVRGHHETLPANTGYPPAHCGRAAGGQGRTGAGPERGAALPTPGPSGTLLGAHKTPRAPAEWETGGRGRPCADTALGRGRRIVPLLAPQSP